MYIFSKLFSISVIFLSLNFLVPASLWAMGKKPEVENQAKSIDIQAEEKFGKAPDARKMAEPPLGREIAVSEELERKASTPV